MEVAGNLVVTWWMWVMIATVGILLSLCVILKLRELGICPLQEATAIIRRPWFETLFLLFCVGGLIQYGATKGTNGTENANQFRLPQRSGLQSGDLRGPGDGLVDTFAITNLCFTRIVPLSNSVCLSVAWPTNMFVEGTTLDFFAKVNALTNGPVFVFARHLGYHGHLNDAAGWGPLVSNWVSTIQTIINSWEGDDALLYQIQFWDIDQFAELKN